jgi:hypothetical protein
LLSWQLKRKPKNKQTKGIFSETVFTFLTIFGQGLKQITKYDKQDQQGKAAFNERKNCKRASVE